MLTSAANEPGGTGSLGVLQDYLHRRMGVLAVRIERRRDEACMPWAQLRLPPFPQVAIRVLQLVSNENVQLHELGDLISSDAAFASEVLTIANSLLYAPRFPASSILQAIAVLGANHLQGLCLTVAVRAYLGRSLNHPMMRLLWRHSLACALIAEQLASTGFMDKDAAYTSGVLHDIGRFALAVVKPKEYADLLANHVEHELLAIDPFKNPLAVTVLAASSTAEISQSITISMFDCVYWPRYSQRCGRPRTMFSKRPAPGQRSRA